MSLMVDFTNVCYTIEKHALKKYNYFKFNIGNRITLLISIFMPCI